MPASFAHVPAADEPAVEPAFEPAAEPAGAPEGAGEAGEPEGIAGEDPIGLGLRFWLEDRPEGGRRLVARFRPGPGHLGTQGFLHGGVAAAALDETMASLSWALDDRPCVTATLDLRFRRPVPVDQGPLRLEAWRDRAERPERRRRHRVRGHLVLPDGTVAVEANGIFVAE